MQMQMPSPPLTHYYAFLNPPSPYPLRNYLMDAPKEKNENLRPVMEDDLYGNILRSRQIWKYEMNFV